jgi:hypothetical protein
VKATKVIGPAKERELVACEKRMKDASRDAVVGLASVGMELKRIHDEELYLTVHSTWNDYVEKRCGMLVSRSFELIRIGERLPTILDQAKDLGLPIPGNEWQMQPLLKLPPGIAVEAWKKAAVAAEEEKATITRTYVERFAQAEAVVKPPKPVEEIKVIDATPPVEDTKEDYEFDEQDKEDDPRLKTYSIKARLTIERVGIEIGSRAKDAILSGTLKVSDRELVNWGTYKDEEFVALGKFLIEQRWPYSKSKKYLFQTIDSKTRLETIFNLANAQGGQVEIKVGSWKIKVFRHGTI